MFSSTLPELKLLNDGKRRLFVDPASISSGWALFEGSKLVGQGTVLADKRRTVFERLSYVYGQYLAINQLEQYEEVHIEKIPRRCHHYTIWSVAVIGLALYSLSGGPVDDDLPVRSWQKVVNWRGNEKAWQLKLQAGSEDETVAVLLGHYYLNKLYLEQEGKDL